MKTKFFVAIVLLLSVSEVYSQFKVNFDGSVQFKVGGYWAGYTGNYNTAIGYYAGGE